MSNSGIKMFLHCRKCVEERPAGISPANYAAIAVGIGDAGLIVWCQRHDTEITTFPMKSDDVITISREACGTPSTYADPERSEGSAR